MPTSPSWCAPPRNRVSRRASPPTCGNDMAASKLMTLHEMVERVPDGASLALGGSFLHRGPFAFVRELIRQKKKDLEIIKQSPGYDIDILCRAGAVTKVRAGIVAMEGN